MTIDVYRLHAQVTAWLQASRLHVQAAMRQPLDVTTKSNRNDLVTNVDQQNQLFLAEQIQTAYPDAHIEGEEGTTDKVNRLDGLVFFVDPIDGTMNFVKQRAHFAIMIGVYDQGQPVYGAIMDVMQNTIVAGGPDFPARVNDVLLPALPDLALADGLIGVNGPMHAHNRMHIADIALASSGARMSGSAGMEFMEIAQNRQLGYISFLKPWDVAAGMAIVSGQGVVVTRPDGSPIDLLTAGLVVAATPKAHQEILTWMQTD